MRFPFVKEKRPHSEPDMETRGISSRPAGEDKSTILSDDIIPGRPAAIGTVSAVSEDDEWFDPSRTKQDAPERKDMPRPQHPEGEADGAV
jgi:hypothetical protein